MITQSIRIRALLNWRLRLQTSGIYRDSAIPGGQIKIKTGGSAASRRLPPWSGPGGSAQVASLQSLILCSGQSQCRSAEGIRKVCNCRRSGEIIVADREK